MQVSGFKIIAASLLFMSLSGIARADMVFQKKGNHAITLTLKNDNTATITKGRTALIDGQVQGQGSSLEIVRPEGDVCPDVSVELYHDIELGENALAEVHNEWQDAGTAAYQYCSDLAVLDGSYVRVK